jgi:hypothetical protein
MKKKLTLLLVLALALVMLVGCGRLGNPKDPGTTADKTDTNNFVDDVLKTLDDLPKTQSNQTDVADADILIP